MYNLYLFIYCHPLVHVWVICCSFTYDLDVSVFAVRRVSQLYVNIFMPALPVSSVCTKANTHNIFPILFLFVCILKFDFLPFTVLSAGCFHVPAAGTLSTEPGTVHILQKHDDSRRAAVKVQTESMFVFSEFAGYYLASGDRWVLWKCSQCSQQLRPPLRAGYGCCVSVPTIVRNWMIETEVACIIMCTLSSQDSLFYITHQPFICGKVVKVNLFFCNSTVDLQQRTPSHSYRWHCSCTSSFVWWDYTRRPGLVSFLFSTFQHMIFDLFIFLLL